MIDAATRQLIQYLANTQGSTLWFADEQIDASAAAAAPLRTGLQVVTNRCDTASLLTARGLTVTQADFDNAIASGLQHAAFRIAKEKALVHYVINRALAQLAPGGKLLLSGYKNEGIKTYLEKAAACAGSSCVIERSDGALCGVIERGAQLGAALPDQDYALLRPVVFGDELTLWSKPGIFGWQKLDAGSIFLCEQLERVWPTAPARVLDLGCGYGYLTALAARRWPAAEFTATDNNVAAVAACARNLQQESIRGVALVADCAAGITESFDAILCNPPFHQGFDVESELTTRFLASAKRLLRRGGRALFVVNQFIALERRAAAMFGKVDVVARNRSFKLVMLER
jgi:16S rRNA (guanine1207-N2)-methyltransferase